MGYSPWGPKESDSNERLTYISDTSLLFVINVPNISSQDMACLFTFLGRQAEDAFHFLPPLSVS